MAGVLTAPGEMFDNMMQLMRFSVYFKGILNTDNGYFHIKLMISVAHMLWGSWACSLRTFLKKNATWCVLMFLCILYYGPPDKFLRMLYAAPLRSVS